jgi:hypothetical protein
MQVSLPASLARFVVSIVGVPVTGANAIVTMPMKAVTVQLDRPGGGSAVLLLPNAVTTAIQGQMDAKDMTFFSPITVGTLEASEKRPLALQVQKGRCVCFPTRIERLRSLEF